ncbi:DUF4167 domain-containing protein [Lentibacter sp. XHP0401]|jgi:sRNA-binding protein|uniref:DUF4167 domain-containing protein n=1 Tax=Lentibacter sp. XHP0401 TaxID=2984334 RepID=UPI0021E90784|nr:DUF4167 domain-containing protein [Lentibacter sp. XHP0401]MCV2891718.1 DUF4167 domain-containing protein [Lentibacter sp. XHP0401]
MRSSKSRSRSKNNRNNNRPSGNIVNRVFDSSGPEGKVRGTPQQIIEKYNQLARDSQLAGDRVATENFQQHAEHYQRMLSEAMAEENAKREQQEQQNRERQAERDREAAERRERQERESNGGGNEQPREPREPRKPRKEPVASDASEAPQPDVPADTPHPEISQLEMMRSSDNDSGLVETPESASEKPKRVRKPRRKKEAPGDEGGSSEGGTEAAE